MQKRNLSFLQLFNLSFGFFGVQIAYALQSANISRIFSSLGADPHSLSFFWVLPPLMGMLVQPLVGKYSDRTWNKLGRRKPYLLIGAIIAVAVMLTLPNASTMVRILGLAVNQVLWFGVFSLIFLDTSINIAMQPFKMMVGDMVNEEQKGKAYAIQSFLCNAGSLVGFVLPYVLALFAVSNTAAIGEIPNTVKFSFYIGALILILCVLYTFFAVKEMNPEEYAKFHGLENKKADEPTPGLFKLLVKAPKTFWTISLVQFFCWAAFLYMWTYTPGAIAKTAFNAPDAQIMETYVDGEGNSLMANYFYFEGNDSVKAQFLVEKHVLMDTVLSKQLLTTAGTKLIYGEIAEETTENDSTFLQIVDKNELIVSEGAVLTARTDINVVSKEYNDAGNWVGILFAVQAIGSIIWAVFIPRFRRRKVCYSVSLALGGLGFISTLFITNQYVLFLSFLLIGCAWAAMLALPFTIFTNSLKDHIGSYLGLFNCTICLPQIIAALLGGVLLKNICAGAQVGMLVVAGVLLLCGAAAVFIIKQAKE